MSQSPTDRRTTAARGYVLFIVLVLGVAAGLSAAALLSTRGGAELNAMHSEVGDQSALLAEAGMQRAIFYVNDILGNYGDFDAALDTDLNHACAAPGTAITPASDDLRPDTSADADALVEWTDAISGAQSIGGKNYTCVSYGGGRYCVHFEDDDDDVIDNDLWEDNTGNNEKTGSVCANGSESACYEGPSGSDSVCSNDNSAENNPVRDRNRAIWVISIGIYPDVPFANATHKTTLRRMHMAPRFPTVAGLKVKGDVLMSGSGKFAACSDVGSVAIDGTVDGNNKLCASGRSRADDWIDSDRCANTSMCNSIPYGSSWSITPLDGLLEEPGPVLPPMPDPWDNANEWVDFERPCVFWVDHGTPSDSTHGISGTGLKGRHTLWVWDATAARGPGGDTCSTFETVAAPNAAMPGPPLPDAAPGGGVDCLTSGDGNPSCWRGCWTPIMFFDTSTTTITAPLVDAATPDTSLYRPESLQCYHPLWRSSLSGDPLGLTPGANLLLERAASDGGSPGGCDWRPMGATGQYQVCDPASPTSCWPWGKDSSLVGLLLGNETTDPLNRKLAAYGITPGFPADTILNKPDWDSACTVEYPPAESGFAPVSWNCTQCTSTLTNGVRFGQNIAIYGRRGGQAVSWIKPQSQTEAKAVPAGVYFFSKSFNVNGSNYGWGADATDGTDNPPFPWTSLDQYPLTTMMNDESMELQFADYTWGIGQQHPGAGNNGEESDWSIFSTWITGDLLTMGGGGTAAHAGSVYAATGADWEGSAKHFVFGKLYTNGDFDMGGSGEFYWLYRVRLDPEVVGGYAGVNASQTYIAQ